jgi:hypothetical protein
MKAKHLVPIAVVASALVLVLGIAVGALARSGGSGPMPVGPASVTSRSEHPAHEPERTHSAHEGEAPEPSSAQSPHVEDSDDPEPHATGPGVESQHEHGSQGCDDSNHEHGEADSALALLAR